MLRSLTQPSKFDLQAENQPLTRCHIMRQFQRNIKMAGVMLHVLHVVCFVPHVPLRRVQNVKMQASTYGAAELRGGLSQMNW